MHFNLIDDEAASVILREPLEERSEGEVEELIEEVTKHLLPFTIPNKAG
ncbi:hypothetical protein ACFQ9Y_09505 [Peribacillus simplex]